MRCSSLRAMKGAERGGKERRGGGREVKERRGGEERKDGKRRGRESYNGEEEMREMLKIKKEIIGKNDRKEQDKKRWKKGNYRGSIERNGK